MKTTTATIAALCCVQTLVGAQEELRRCPLLGQQYPPPLNLSTEPIFQSTMESIGAMLDGNASVAPYNTTTYSIGVFSVGEPGLAWEYHHSTALLANSSYGTTAVDADSVYRIASISKLLTVYLLLICEGDEKFSDYITKWLPELAGIPTSDMKVTDWSSVTIGDLAGHIAGISRHYALADIAIADGPLPPSLEDLLPKPPASEVPDCGWLAVNGSYITCIPEQYLEGVAYETPVFVPGYTAAYANGGFALIATAVERMTGIPWEELVDERLVSALNLTGTSYTVPSGFDGNYVIPASPLAAGWDAEFEVFGAAAGFFTSTNDFATIGKAMLNSTLIPSDQTRRWFKPSSFLEDPMLGVGRPWEIVRMSAVGRTVDIYTKAGDWGAYNTLVLLIPDYQVGFTIFTAPDPNSALLGAGLLRNDLPNDIAERIITAVDQVAKAQAVKNFAGTYRSKTSNSSITIASDDSPALRLTGWINDGADLYTNLFPLLAPETEIRLLPNMLYDGNEVGFTSHYPPPAPNQLFYGSCTNWFNVDGISFGNVPLGHFVFKVDAAGSAVSVESKAFKVTMERAN